MSNAILKLEINPAEAYVISKGRLPNDAQELMDWLNEFADYETRRCDAIFQAYQAHMNVCVRPIVFSMPHPLPLSGERK